MKYTLYITIAFFILARCGGDDRAMMISSEANAAESVYLTHDQNDNPVIVWTERDGNNLTLFFAISHDHGKSFAQKTSLALAADVATHAEGMPKVAFKKDGTIVAAYEKKAPTRENKYAGAIYYVMSGDQGRSWTPEVFLHNDTVAGRSRSYFDIERLPDGEIGASWLDVKLDHETGGRSVRFSRTTRSKGFAHEILVDSSACQCCRIDVYSDMSGRVNVAYRGLMKGKVGQSIRDVMIATSENHGETFTSPVRISQDNWAIEGCPHTGPSLCSSKSGLYSLWYTEGNGTGIYYSFKQNADSAFGQRQLISNSGRHPQLSGNNTGFIMVWEENSGEGEEQFTRVLYQVNDGENVKKDQLSPGGFNAFVPVVTPTAEGFLVAFLMETKNGVKLYSAKL
jgi:hypothetical protein